MSDPNGDAWPPAPVVVPVWMVRPTPVAFAKAVWRFVSGGTDSEFRRRLRATRSGDEADGLGGINAMTFAPVALTKVKAHYVVDSVGLRLEGSRELRLAVAWTEIARTMLQIQHSPSLGLRVLRIVLWPTDPQAFAARHPRSQIAWDAEVGGIVLAVVKAQEIPPDAITLAVSALRLAGPRYLEGVEEVQTT